MSKYGRLADWSHYCALKNYTWIPERDQYFGSLFGTVQNVMSCGLLEIMIS